jgi:PKD domain-containing protein
MKLNKLKGWVLLMIMLVWSITAYSQAKTTPTLILTVNPLTGTIPQTVTFTASCSTCVTYAWSFGDGSVQTIPGPKQTHTYTVAGTYYVIVAATDKSGNPAIGQATVSILPNYTGTNKSLDIIQIQSPAPNFGNAVGANNCVTPTDFGHTICRITDRPLHKNDTWNVEGGGGTAIMSNCDNTLLAIGNVGGTTSFFSLDPASIVPNSPKMQSAILYNGFSVPSTVNFSRDCPSGTTLAYALHGTTLQTYNLSSLTTPPVPQDFYNYASSKNCLGSVSMSTGAIAIAIGSTSVPVGYKDGDLVNIIQSGASGGVAKVTVLDGNVIGATIIVPGTHYSVANDLPTTASTGVGKGLTLDITKLSGNVNWKALHSQALNDAAFGTAWSTGSFQGTGVYVTVYVPGQGCTMLDTQTGNVTGDFGINGTISIPDRFTLHGTTCFVDGNYCFLSFTTCLSKCSSPAFGYYIWTPGTLDVSICSVGCDGHPGHGYSKLVMNNWWLFPAADPALYIVLQSSPPGWLSDLHYSWNNANSNDSSCLFGTTDYSDDGHDTYPAKYTFALEQELFCMMPADGPHAIRYRFAHTLCSGKSPFFEVAQCIGNVDQLGNLYFMTSDALGTLGSTAGADVCTVGQDCAGDVFVIDLTHTSGNVK